jgi:hypothetical protein
MKTPTSLYLAYRGWFVANVPLVPGLPLPSGLLAVPRNRVFCLLVDPARLIELRRARAKHEGTPLASYASWEQVVKELQYAQRVCLEQRWRSIDVTGKSAEEVSREIIALSTM